jgi:tetratricopeptide (TPR) repeat protein/DNA-binding XRE family transcriptional regulator
VVAVDPPVVSFARLLRQLRVNAGLSQEELAEAAGVGVRTVSDLERGVALTARKDTARLLADALSLSGADRASFDAIARRRAVADASLAPDGVVGGTGGVAVATRALPRDIASFTGRQAELRQLMDVTAGSSRPGVVSIHAIGGMAGIGKTALAVHAAHQLAPRFPDGQIFLPLQGHTPGQRPVEPSDALASLLLTIGVSAARIPPGLQARISLWRDWLAGKQLLLLLDDAADSEQVRPLLPGTTGSLVLVTSRRHLTALEDAQLVSLDILPAEQAAELLVRLAARPGLDPGDPEVVQITRLCGYLPLAVGMLARQLYHHPAWTAADLAADLAATRDRLQMLHAENLSVAAAFDLSYRDLTQTQQRLFRHLGLYPGTDIDVYAAAALDGTEPPEARRHLEALYDQYLIAEPARGRYRFHDLIREHARALAATDPPVERDAASGRLLDYYLHAAANAEIWLTRQRRAGPDPSVLTSASAVLPDLLDPEQAMAWARAERANLLACLDHAGRAGQHARVVALTAAIACLLRQDGPWTDAITRHKAAARAAGQLGDRRGEAGALNNLGDALQLSGDYPGATKTLTEALGIYRNVGDRLGEANALGNLGVVQYQTSDYTGATQALEQALGIYREIGDRLGEANTLSDLGATRAITGDIRGGSRRTEEALGIYHDIGDRIGEAFALCDLANARRATGDYPGATQAAEEALRIFRDLGDRRGHVVALLYLGSVRELTGDYPGAAQAAEEALRICRDLGNPLQEADALFSLGSVRVLTGDYPGAVRLLEEALGIYRDHGAQMGHGNALQHLGYIRLMTGDYPGAVRILEEALGICRDIGDPEGEAWTLLCLGSVRRMTGDYPGAARILEEALGICRDIGDPEGEGRTLNEAGTLYRVRGSSDRAEIYHRRALTLAREIGSPWIEAHSLGGLGRCALAAGRTADAEAGLRQALEIFRRIGAAEAPGVAAELDALTKAEPS